MITDPQWLPSDADMLRWVETKKATVLPILDGPLKGTWNVSLPLCPTGSCDVSIHRAIEMAMRLYP